MILTHLVCDSFIFCIPQLGWDETAIAASEVVGEKDLRKRPYTVYTKQRRADKIVISIIHSMVVTFRCFAFDLAATVVGSEELVLPVQGVEGVDGETIGKAILNLLEQRFFDMPIRAWMRGSHI